MWRSRGRDEKTGKEDEIWEQRRRYRRKMYMHLSASIRLPSTTLKLTRENTAHPLVRPPPLLPNPKSEQQKLLHFPWPQTRRHVTRHSAVRLLQPLCLHDWTTAGNKLSTFV